jgi:DNA repair protein RadC
VLDRGVFISATDTKETEVRMRTYRVELVRESGGDELEETILRTSTDVARALRPLFEGIDREKFVVVLVDAKHCLIGSNTVSIGSLSASIVCPRLCVATHKRGYVAATVMLSSA